MSFDQIFERTVGFEGGYVNDPNDPGGETKYGISKRAYPDLDIARLTLAQAKAIYSRDYWDRLNLDQIKPEVIAGEIFDTAVNMGLTQAALITQRALSFFGEKLIEDGILGPQTISILNKWGFKDPEALFKALNGEQYAVYKHIIKTRPQLIRYARGWLKRVQSYLEEI